MVAVPKSPLTILIQKLSGTRGLSDAEQQAIRSLPVTVRTLDGQQHIAPDGVSFHSCCIILDGWVCCYQLLEEGRRPIFSIHIPGDLPDLQSLHLPDPDFSMIALTRATVAFVPHAELRKVMAALPNLSAALWREALINAAIHRAWMASLGRRDARGRLAHLCCELYLRLSAAGLADGYAIPMPLRQNDLADALGLTPVHVNRTLKDLRGDGLISLHGRRLEIWDWSGLQRAAEFNPKYLHLALGEPA